VKFTESIRQRGRPTKYTPAIGLEICRLISITPGPMAAIFASRPDFPVQETIYDWEEKHPEFHKEFNRARAIRAHYMVDDALRIADGAAGDTLEGRHGPAADHEWINRSRLRVETRLRIARSFNPIYRDKNDVDLKATVGGVLELRWKTSADDA